MQRMLGHVESPWVLPCHTQQVPPTTLHTSTTRATRRRFRYRYSDRYAVAPACVVAPAAAGDVAIHPPTKTSTSRNVTDEQLQLQRAAKSAKLSGDLNRSREILRLALERYPGDKNFRVQLASAEAKLGRTKQALELLHEGLQEDPSNVFFLTSSASIYGQQRKYDKARELFQRGYSAARNSAPLLQVSSTGTSMHASRAARLLCCRGLYSGHGPSRLLHQDMHSRCRHAPAATWRRLLMPRASRCCQWWRTHQLIHHAQQPAPSASSICIHLCHTAAHLLLPPPPPPPPPHHSRSPDPHVAMCTATLPQAWAVMESKARNLDAARELFEMAAAADPRHAPVYQAWAKFEARHGQPARAQQLFKEGYAADPGHVPNLHVSMSPADRISETCMPLQ